MLFKERVTLYSENRKKPKNVKLVNVKAGGIYSQYRFKRLQIWLKQVKATLAFTLKFHTSHPLHYMDCPGITAGLPW